MSKALSKTSNAAKWMQEGIRQHEAFERTFLAAKEHALNAGLFFLSAKNGFEHGEWENFIGGYSHKINIRTVQRYVEFATEVLEWVKSEQPKLLGMEKISEAARGMVLKSPKGFIALCRELKLMRKFGEYDEVKYRTKKLLGAKPQLEFSFGELATSIDVLTHFGDENYSFKYPEGRAEEEVIDEMIAKTETALARLKMIKQHGRVIKTSEY